MEESKVTESTKKNSTGKEKSAPRKENRIIKFFEGVKAEYNKIAWPSKDDVIKQTTAVVIISLISGALIAALDYGFSYGINILTNLKL